MAFRCAEQELKAKAVNDETVKRLGEAVDDLAKCTRILGIRSFEDSNLKLYHNLHDRLRATVTLAEVEMASQ